MKKILTLFLCLSLILLSNTACSAQEDAWANNVGNIDLDTLSFSGNGISVSGGVIHITQGGDFTVTGTLTDGMIQISTDSQITLRLSNVHITNTSGPAIFFENTKKASVILDENTTNSLEDASEYTVDAKATLFSNDDLEIDGDGTLNITGHYKHGIASDDTLTIKNGTLQITAVTDAIHVNDALTVSGGSLTLNAVGDGIDCEGSTVISSGSISISTTGEIVDDTSPSSKGIKSVGDMTISGGEISIASSDHAIDGDAAIDITAGVLTLRSESGKGISGQGDVTISGGQIDVVKSTEGIESKAILTIADGTIQILSSDDGLNAGGGTSSFPGGMGGGMRPQDDRQAPSDGQGQPPERPQAPSGDTSMQPPENDEGAQPPEGNGSPQRGGGMPSDVNGTAPEGSQPPEGAGTPPSDDPTVQDQTDSEHKIIISGGQLYINSGADGLDSNGLIEISGGSVTIDGPTNGGESALDCEGGIIVTGGNIIAAGSAGMAQAPGNGSTQNTLNITFSQQQAAGSRVTISDEAGTEIISYAPAKQYQSLILSSPDLVLNQTYTISVDDEVIETVTLTQTVTAVGSYARGGMGGGGRRGPGGMQMQSPDQNRTSDSQVYQEEDVTVIVEGTNVDMDQTPIRENDRLLVPLRSILESMGAQVEWDEASQTVTASKEGVTIVLEIGKRQAATNGETVTLDVAPKLVEDTTYVPIRFIGESLGLAVNWDEASQTVSVG